MFEELCMVPPTTLVMRMDTMELIQGSLPRNWKRLPAGKDKPLRKNGLYLGIRSMGGQITDKQALLFYSGGDR